MVDGSWNCNGLADKSCKNDRNGQVCSLSCDAPLMVCKYKKIISFLNPTFPGKERKYNCVYTAWLGSSCWLIEVKNQDFITWLCNWISLRCYGCSPPADPPHGHWDCDVAVKGMTVCMLQCNVSQSFKDSLKFWSSLQPGFVIEGSHVIVCDSEKGKFPEEASKAKCAPSYGSKYEL